MPECFHDSVSRGWFISSWSLSPGGPSMTLKASAFCLQASRCLMAHFMPVSCVALKAMGWHFLLSGSLQNLLFILGILRGSDIWLSGCLLHPVPDWGIRCFKYEDTFWEILFYYFLGLLYPFIFSLTVLEIPISQLLGFLSQFSVSLFFHIYRTVFILYSKRLNSIFKFIFLMLTIILNVPKPFLLYSFVMAPFSFFLCVTLFWTCQGVPVRD